MTDSGNIIIADFNYSKIKLYATDGNLLSSLMLSSKPNEVTVFKTRTLLSVCLKGRCVNGSELLTLLTV